MFVHFSGYVLVAHGKNSEIDFSYSDEVFPHMLSTESNFCFEMLNQRATLVATPSEYITRSPYTMYLMMHSSYFVEVRLPTSRSKLFYAPFTTVPYRSYGKPYDFYSYILSCEYTLYNQFFFRK